MGLSVARRASELLISPPTLTHISVPPLTHITIRTVSGNPRDSSPRQHSACSFRATDTDAIVADTYLDHLGLHLLLVTSVEVMRHSGIRLEFVLFDFMPPNDKFCRWSLFTVRSAAMSDLLIPLLGYLFASISASV